MENLPLNLLKFQTLQFPDLLGHNFDYIRKELMDYKL